MRKIIVILLVSMAFSYVNAQESDTKPTPEQKIEMDKKLRESMRTDKGQSDNPNAPEIKFNKTTHDYGEIMAKGDGNCEFKFTNEGKEPLILSNVRSSCGCTIPVWPRHPILPGQSEVIKVKYDTKRVGVINKSIQVYSNAKTSPVTLRIKGKITPYQTTTSPVKEATEATPSNEN